MIYISILRTAPPRPGYSRNFWETECPILLLVPILRNCRRYVNKIDERKVYVLTLSSNYLRDKN